MIDQQHYQSKIMLTYPNCNWILIWKTVNTIKNIKKKLVIFKYIHKILPTPEYLFRYGIINNIPLCNKCKQVKTLKHVFEHCQYTSSLRSTLISDLHKLQSDILVDTDLYQTTNNLTVRGNNVVTVCNLIFDYVYDVWRQYHSYV